VAVVPPLPILILRRRQLAGNCH